jgi:hypothetical protein
VPQRPRYDAEQTASRSDHVYTRALFSMSSGLGRMVACAVIALASRTVPAEPVEMLPNRGGEKINERIQPTYLGVQNSGEIQPSPLPRTGDRAIRPIARPHEWKVFNLYHAESDFVAG